MLSLNSITEEHDPQINTDEEQKQNRKIPATSIFRQGLTIARVKAIQKFASEKHKFIKEVYSEEFGDLELGGAASSSPSSAAALLRKNFYGESIVADPLGDVYYNGHELITRRNEFRQTQNHFGTKGGIARYVNRPGNDLWRYFMDDFFFREGDTEAFTSAADGGLFHQGGGAGRGQMLAGPLSTSTKAVGDFLWDFCVNRISMKQLITYVLAFEIGFVTVFAVVNYGLSCLLYWLMYDLLEDVLALRAGRDGDPADHASSTTTSLTTAGTTSTSTSPLWSSPSPPSERTFRHFFMLSLKATNSLSFFQTTEADELIHPDGERGRDNFLTFVMLTVLSLQHYLQIIFLLLLTGVIVARFLQPSQQLCFSHACCVSDGVLKPTIFDNSVQPPGPTPNVVANINTTTSKSVTEMVRIRSNSKNAGGSSLTTANRSPRPGSLLASSSMKASPPASGNQDHSSQQNVNIKPLKGPKGKIKNRILMPVNEPEPIIVTSSALAFLNRMLLSAKANSNAAGGTSGGAGGVVPGQESSSSSGSPASGGPLQNGTSLTLHLPGGNEDEEKDTNGTKLPLVGAGAGGDKNPDMPRGPAGAAPAKARALSSEVEDKFVSTSPARSDLEYKEAAPHPEGSAAHAPGSASVAGNTIGNAGRASSLKVEPAGPTTSNSTGAETKALKSKRSRSASSLPASGAAAANDDKTVGSKNRTSGATASSSDRRVTSSNRADSSQLRNSSSSLVAGGPSTSAAIRNPGGASSKKTSRSVSPDQDGNILTAPAVATTSSPASGGTSSKKSAKIVVENRAADVPNNTTKSLAGGGPAKVKKSKTSITTSSSPSKGGPQLVLYNEGEHKAQMVPPAGDEDASAFRSSSTSAAGASKMNKKEKHLLQLPPAKGNAVVLAVAPPAFPTAERAPPAASTGAQTSTIAGARPAMQTKGVPQLQQLLSPRMGPGGGLLAAPADRSTTSPRGAGNTSVPFSAAGLQPPPPPGGADPVPDEKFYYPDSDWLEYPELVLRLMVIRENVILVQPKIVLQLVTRSGLMYELQAQVLSNSTSLSSSGSSSSTKPTNSGGEQVLDTTGNKPSNTEIDQLLQDHPAQYQLLPMLTVHSPNGGILTIKHIINEASPLHEKNLGLRELFLINCSVLAVDQYSGKTITEVCSYVCPAVKTVQLTAAEQEEQSLKQQQQQNIKGGSQLLGPASTTSDSTSRTTSANTMIGSDQIENRFITVQELTQLQSELNLKQEELRTINYVSVMLESERRTSLKKEIELRAKELEFKKKQFKKWCFPDGTFKVPAVLFHAKFKEISRVDQNLVQKPRFPEDNFQNNFEHRKHLAYKNRKKSCFSRIWYWLGVEEILQEVLKVVIENFVLNQTDDDEEDVGLIFQHGSGTGLSRKISAAASAKRWRKKNFLEKVFTTVIPFWESFFQPLVLTLYQLLIRKLLLNFVVKRLLCGCCLSLLRRQYGYRHAEEYYLSKKMKIEDSTGAGGYNISGPGPPNNSSSSQIDHNRTSNSVVHNNPYHSNTNSWHPRRMYFNLNNFERVVRRTDFGRRGVGGGGNGSGGAFR
ncbi:unnamed protein product [Amoebophrya sp. A120]|nr:unnamed protein product [Amoebophrya sp. A120]|eukprot:GSA120T00006972001.1